MTMVLTEIDWKTEMFGVVPLGAICLGTFFWLSSEFFASSPYHLYWVWCFWHCFLTTCLMPGLGRLSHPRMPSSPQPCTLLSTDDEKLCSKNLWVVLVFWLSGPAFQVVGIAVGGIWEAPDSGSLPTLACYSVSPNHYLKLYMILIP